jgi:hypothetical protein
LTTRPNTRALPFATVVFFPVLSVVVVCHGERRDAHAAQRQQTIFLRDVHFGGRAAVLALRLQLALVLLGQPAQPVGAVFTDGGFAHARRLLDLHRHTGHQRRIGVVPHERHPRTDRRHVAVRLAHAAREHPGPQRAAGRRAEAGGKELLARHRDHDARHFVRDELHRRGAQQDPERVEDRMVDVDLVAPRLDAVDQEAAE